MFHKGNIIIYLVFLVVLVVGGYFIWKSIDLLYPSGNDLLNNIPFIFKKSDKIDETVNWKVYESTVNLSLRYPSDWIISGQDLISQYPYKIGDRSNIYNAISIKKINQQMHPGYINSEWFDIMYGLKNTERFKNLYYDNDKINEIKYDKGNTDKGLRYIIIISDDENTLTTYILYKYDLYLISISFFDNAGLDVFKKIIKTVNFMLD